LLQAEFLYPFFIGGDGGAFDAYAMLLYRIGSVDGYLVVGLVPMLQPHVILFYIKLDVLNHPFFFF
jgi:hypothetical protein